MGNVGVGHDEIVIPQKSLPSPSHGSPVDGYKLAYLVIVADDQSGRLALIAQSLGSAPKGNEGEQMAPIPDFRPSLGYHMRFQDGIFPDLYIFPDYTVGPDLDPGGQLGFGMDNGCWMDFQLGLLIKSQFAFCFERSGNRIFGKGKNHSPLPFG
jgi:hypothetical protein